MTESFPSRSYRFVQDKSEFLFLNDSTGKACLKFILMLLFSLGIILFLVVGTAFLFFSVEQVLSNLRPFAVKLAGSILLNPDKAIVLFFPFLVFAALHAHSRNLAIVVEEKGMAFYGFLFTNIGKHYEWQDFVQIRRMSQSQGDVLVFIDRYGRSFLIRFGKPRTPKRKFFSWSFSWSELKKEKQNRLMRSFVGEGHALSLLEAIEEFHGPVTLLDEEERKKIPALHQGLCWNSVIEGRASHLVFAATCLILLALAGHFTQYFLLDTWQSRARFWADWFFCGLGFFFAWHCLKREESREAAWIISLLFAAPLWFLATPAATLLPVWLGEARQETFFVSQDARGRQQDWHAEKIPGLSFAREIPRKRRAHEPGARREFTVYHGPLGLYAMPLAELKPLWTEEQSPGE